MSKFKAGDLVRIKSKEQLAEQFAVTIGGHFYYQCHTAGITFRGCMWQGCGSQFILKQHYATMDRWWRYDLPDGSIWYWDEDWLEPVTPPVLLSISDLEDLL